jgi:alpha-1,2-glucosyltransferase
MTTIPHGWQVQLVTYIPRMRSSMFLSHRLIAVEILTTGMIRLRLLLACKHSRTSDLPRGMWTLTRRRYLISYVVFRLTRRCDLTALRYLNACLVCLIAVVASSLQASIMSSVKKRYSKKDFEFIGKISGRVAINTALFPPLFFFCALYYTDVASTLVVLLSIYSSMLWQNSNFVDIKWLAVALITGLYSLICRQTNIFWVAIFPAGLAAVRFLENSGLNLAKSKSSAGYQEIMTASWKRLEVYDVPVNDAYLEGMCS